MTRSYEYKLLFPDARKDGKKTPLAKALDQAGFSVYSKYRASQQPDAMLTRFHGRNRVSKDINKLVKQIDCPVIGLELFEEGDRNDPTIHLDVLLNHDTPYPLIAHVIRSIIQSDYSRKDTKRLETELNDLQTRLDSVVQLGLQLTGTLSYHELFDLVVNQASGLVAGDIHALFTVDSNGLNSRLRQASNNRDCNPIRITPTHRVSSDLHHALSSFSCPVTDTAPFNEHPFIGILCKQLGTFSSAIVAPFHSKSHLLGYLIIARQNPAVPFSQKEIEQIEILSSFSSMAMANAFVYEQTETATRTDNLTRVYNFAYINQFLDRLISAQEEFSLVFLDLDGFKKVNLVHGHTVGNKALKAAAEKITESQAPYCMVGRFGGDEFVVVMPGINAVEARDQAGITIKAIESLDEEMNFRLSASAGIAEFPSDGDTLKVLIHAADTAMYKAKDRGRGQALLYRELTED